MLRGRVACDRGWGPSHLGPVEPTVAFFSWLVYSAPQMSHVTTDVAFVFLRLTHFAQHSTF